MSGNYENKCNDAFLCLYVRKKQLGFSIIYISTNVFQLKNIRRILF